MSTKTYSSEEIAAGLLRQFREAQERELERIANTIHNLVHIDRDQWGRVINERPLTPTEKRHIADLMRQMQAAEEELAASQGKTVLGEADNARYLQLVAVLKQLIK